MLRTVPSMDHGGALVAPPSVTTDVELAALDRAAQDHLRQNRPANTLARYADDMRAWGLFCREYGVEPTLISSGLLMSFVMWLDERRQAAVSTMSARVVGVTVSLRDLHGLDQVPVGITRAAFEKIKQIEQRLAEEGVERGRGQAEEITPQQLRALCEAQPDTLMGLRNKTLMSMSGYLGNRVAENAALVAPDITGTRTFRRVRVRWSKTGPKTPVLSAKPNNDLCPILLWDTWRDAAGITTGPAFPRMDRYGRVFLDTPLTTKAMLKIYKQACQLAGLDVHVTGHTFRAFMATYAYLGGADIRDIANQGGWRPNSPELWRYIRRAQEIAYNATTTFEI